MSKVVAVLTAVAVTSVLVAPAASASSSAAQASPSCANPVACENQQPGTPQSVWDVTSPSTTIQGFADPFSVNVGNAVNFKIESPASSYKVDIYRMGYYGGDGARLVTSLTPSISVSQGQPACNTNTVTGLVDCGNWGVSATWSVPGSTHTGPRTRSRPLASTRPTTGSTLSTRLDTPPVCDGSMNRHALSARTDHGTRV